MGLLFKYSTQPCPNCGAEFYVYAGIIADDQVYVCEKCGARLYLEMRWGRVKSVQRAPGFQGMPPDGSPLPPIDLSKPDGESYQVRSAESRVGNVKYWKEHHGDNWLQAHDEFMRKRGE